MLELIAQHKLTSAYKIHAKHIITHLALGIIHILRNHQGGGGFRNDYANVIFALSNAEFDYGRGEGV